MMDSVPTVFLTGQVRTDLLGTDGFQEADTIGITMPIVKHSFMIQHPLEIPRTIHEAFYVARTGRPGPVIVDIPRRSLARRHPVRAGRADVHLPGYQPTTDGNAKQIRQAAKALAAARRPVIYAGGGVVTPNASRGADRARDRRPLPGHLHADGPRRVPGPARPVARDARDARHARGELRDGRGRPHRRGRRALRRPHHGQAQRVRAAGEVHPHRRRPGRDLQERPGAHPDRRRREEHPRQARWSSTARSGGRPRAPRRVVAAHPRAGRSATRCATRTRPTPRSARSA